MIFSRTKTAPVSLVFDVRDASVTVAAVRIDPAGKPELVFCKRLDIEAAGAIDDPKKYETAMIRTVDAAALAARRSLVAAGIADPVDGGFFFLGSPWAVSESKLVRVKKDRPFEVTDAVLRKIISGEETSSEQNLPAGGGVEWRVLEEKVVQSRLDGYVVERIFGKKTSELAMELFVSFVPASVRSRIAAYASGAFRRGGRLHSRAIASYSFLRDFSNTENSFLYADVGELVTDVYAVANDCITGTASFPFGARSIIAASPRSTLSEEVLLSMVNVHRDGAYATDTERSIERLLAPGIDAWFAKFAETVAGITTEIDAPKKLFFAPASGVGHFLASRAQADGAGPRLYGSAIAVDVIPERALDQLISCGTVCADEPYVKMDVLFLDAIAKGREKQRR